MGKEPVHQKYAFELVMYQVAICKNTNDFQAISTYEPRIRQLVDLFIWQLSQGAPINATDWSMFLGFDLIGRVGLGKDFNCLANGRHDPRILSLHESMGVIGTLGHVPWLLFLLSRIPGATAKYSGFFELCAHEVETKMQVRSNRSAVY